MLRQLSLGKFLKHRKGESEQQVVKDIYEVGHGLALDCAVACDGAPDQRDGAYSECHIQVELVF